MAVGKWHLCLESDLSVAGDTHSWPLQRGFDQYYGFLEALTDFHFPHQLYEGNNPVHVDEYPEGYYLTDDLTDRACRMIRDVKTTDPDKPLFLYYAHGAVHAPLHAKADDIARHRGNYDKGWDQLREERLARQKELGIVPPDAQLPPRNPEPNEDVRAWDSYSEDERQVMARYMEVYAAKVEVHRQERGPYPSRVGGSRPARQHHLRLHQRQRRVPRGAGPGSTSYFTHSGTGARPSPPVSEFELEALEADVIGGPHHLAPLSPGAGPWPATPPSGCTRSPLTGGGHSVPMVLSWPARTEAIGGELRPPSTPTSPISCPPWPTCSASTSPTERHGRLPTLPTGCRLPPTLDDPSAPLRSHRAVHRVHRPPGYLSRRLVGGHFPRASHPVQLRSLGAVQPG